MRNLKHTIMAVVSVAMVGTLSFFQVSGATLKPERDSRLANSNKTESISIEATADEELKQAIAEKSSLTEGYAKVTGTTELKTTPSDDAQSIGTMSGAEDLEVLESTEGWYKVMVDGEAGYVKKDMVTLDKKEAETAAKQYDHYKKATVTSDNGLIVRASGSKDAASVGTVNGGDEVIIVDSQNDYIKILYGEELTEGYVINSGLEFADEWVTKNEVHQEIKEIAYEKAVAARKAEEARKAEAARLAAMGYSAKETKTATVSAPAGNTSKGQAIVNSAKRYLGVPYVWGGTSPRGFDCSGLVQYVCRQNGISVPRVAASQRNAGRYVSRANLQAGDLVFFGNGGRITHVGIYVGNGNMIHAPQTGDVVKISSINSSYRVARYAGAVRVW
ncbi:MAG: C40 family peptidase [Clostridia bacterium]|nr:C40 family peptidase [Clostridia bacterium]